MTFITADYRIEYQNLPKCKQDVDCVKTKIPDSCSEGPKFNIQSDFDAEFSVHRLKPKLRLWECE